MWSRVRPPVEPYVITAVRLFVRDWYTRFDDAEKRIIHIGPWKTEWAALHAGKLVRRHLADNRRANMRQQ